MNPLIAPILSVLKSSEDAISEYQLIKTLQQQGLEFPQADTAELLMFKQHFIVMNALYQLQKDVLLDGYRLEISALVIKLYPLQAMPSSAELMDEAELKLQAYYLDWANFANTDQQDVEALLSGFWNRYYSLEKKQLALEVLGLEADASQHDIRLGYRRLVAQHHPDKGGNPQAFIEIREAYEILCAG